MIIHTMENKRPNDMSLQDIRTTINNTTNPATQAELWTYLRNMGIKDAKQLDAKVQEQNQIINNKSRSVSPDSNSEFKSIHIKENTKGQGKPQDIPKTSTSGSGRK